jgi:hypothetical protein
MESTGSCPCNSTCCPGNQPHMALPHPWRKKPELSVPSKASQVGVDGADASNCRSGAFAMSQHPSQPSLSDAKSFISTKESGYYPTGPSHQSNEPANDDYKGSAYLLGCPDRDSSSSTDSLTRLKMSTRPIPQSSSIWHRMRGATIRGCQHGIDWIVDGLNSNNIDETERVLSVDPDDPILRPLDQNDSGENTILSRMKRVGRYIEGGFGQMG